MDAARLQQIHDLLCKLMPGICADDSAQESNKKDDELTRLQLSLALAQARGKALALTLE